MCLKLERSNGEETYLSRHVVRLREHAGFPLHKPYQKVRIAGLPHKKEEI